MEKAHGRIETRTVQVWRNFTATDPQWQGLFADLVSVQRTRKVFSSKTQEWKRSQENAWFLSTCSLTAEDYMKHIRNHWSIENRKHNVRDQAFKEDNSRIRKNPQIMARLRSFALNLCRANGANNIAATLYENALDLNQLLSWNFIT